MNKKDLTIVRMQCDVENQKIRVKEAKNALNHGYAKLKADFEKEYAALKFAYERALVDLRREETYLAQAIAEKEKGFDD